MSPSLAAIPGVATELLTLGGADLNGYYFSTHYAADNAAPVAKKFIEDYEKTYGDQAGSTWRR